MKMPHIIISPLRPSGTFKSYVITLTLLQGIEDEKLNVPFQQLQNATLTMLIAFEGDKDESFKF